MEQHRFDDLTRRFGTARSRHSLLRALTGAALGAVGLRTTTDAQECMPLGLRCSQRDVCCPGTECRGRTCRCPGGQQECGGVCVDRCPAGQVRGDDCGCACRGETVLCDGECRRPRWFRDNPSHCGACGIACPEGATCERGQCVCPPDRPTVCDLDTGGSRCVDIQTDPSFCGSCFDGCVYGTCQGGECVGGCPQCPDGTVCDEDNACVPLPLCRSTVGACAALGGSCASLPCCSGGCSDGICSCAFAEESCVDQYDCCFGTVCIDGICRPVDDSSPCQSDVDCGIGAFCYPEPVGQPRSCDPCVSLNFEGAGFVVDGCPWPMGGAICAPDPAIGFPGFGHCCIPGENCVGDPCQRPCPTMFIAYGSGPICNGV